ncbi:MAG: hypothetical protein LBD70_07210 [Bifidobacteriaceae bacterium]|jgi:hypothetical protein|nr:hypothetical protein [Bifidobacteriaceae bacterium]
MARVPYVKGFKRRDFLIIIGAVAAAGFVFGIVVANLFAGGQSRAAPKATVTVEAALPLEVGVCLAVSPGELLAEPPEGWKAMTVGCANSSAAVKLIGTDGECPDDYGCWDLVSGETTYQLAALPVEGVCFPAFTDGETRKGWPSSWSPCGDFKRPAELDSAESRQSLADKFGVAVTDLTPVTMRVDKITDDADECASDQRAWTDIHLNGTAYVLCVVEL